MSQSPLARKSRKSLTAFARPPSKLSRSQTADQLYAEADTFSPGKHNSPVKSSSSSVATSTSTGTSPGHSTPTQQNAFATPPRKRASEGGPAQWDSPTPYYATPIRGLTNRRVSVFSPGTYTPPYAGVRPAERRTSYGSNLGTPLPGTPVAGTPGGSPTGTPRATGTRKRFVRRKGVFQRYVFPPFWTSTLILLLLKLTAESWRHPATRSSTCGSRSRPVSRTFSRRHAGPRRSAWRSSSYSGYCSHPSSSQGTK